MKARKLPSGNWCARAYSHTDDNGKKIYVPFTAATKAEAEYLANKFKHDKKGKPAEVKTVGEIVNDYIESREGVLSPSTVRGYRQIARNYFQPLMAMKSTSITSQVLQKAISEEAKRYSGKSVRNAYGLISAALQQGLPDAAFKVRLPAAGTQEAVIPTQNQVSDLMAACDGTPMYNAIILAACLGLRRSEVCALTYSDIQRKTRTVSITKAMVYGEHGWHIKPPKTFSGRRNVRTAEVIIDTLFSNRHDEERVVPLQPNTISEYFGKLCAQTGFSARFHDLRHYNASVMLAIGFPDKYASKRLGHASPTITQKVYQHVMEERSNELDEILDAYFSKQICNEICNDD